MKNSKQFIDQDNSRLDEQKKVMAEIADQAHCPFCRENLEKYHKRPILKEGRFWLITENQWPYEHVKHHWLAIYKSHAETLTELDPAAGSELIQLCAEMVQEFQVAGGALCMRFGDTDHSAGTVLHLHAQLIEPDIDAPDYQPVRFKIGKSPEKIL
jgi:diadenosine tetraphosphate (Ap4A) HIT family hydrolase